MQNAFGDSITDNTYSSNILTETKLKNKNKMGKTMIGGSLDPILEEGALG